MPRLPATRQPTLSPEEQARVRAAREQFRDRPSPEELLASGEYQTIAHEDYLTIRLTVLALRRERERQGLSLADVAACSGLRRASLERLEVGQAVSPRLEVLARYARALGKELVCELRDAATPVAPMAEDGEPIPRKKRRA